MPAWSLIVIWAIAILEIYVLGAPRSWKPWLRHRPRANTTAARSGPTAHYTRSPADDLLDSYIAADEGQITGTTTYPQTMKREHESLVAAGLLDPDQPTPYSHHLRLQQAERDFSPEERRLIRGYLFPDPTA